jgi:hypothetical protein
LVGNKISSNADHIFRGTASMLKPMDIKKETKIRLKTKGDSIIIDSCSNLGEKAASYSGEGKRFLIEPPKKFNFIDVIGGWSHKINNAKEEKPVPGSHLQGAEDSEWD